MSGFSREDNGRFEAALRAWGSDARLGAALDGGHRNDVREVRLGSARFAGRLSRRPRAALDWELRLLDYLDAAGLRVPRPRPADDGRRIVGGLIRFEWLDGEPPAGDADWRLVAVTLGRLHSLTRVWPQRPVFRSTVELVSEARGGDVRLDLMPEEAVTRCRSAWRALGDESLSVVHGDPGVGNIRIAAGRVGLFDWDEARVDRSVLDLAGLPVDIADRLVPERLIRARAAAKAWEAANAWLSEPEYARRRLAQLAG